MRETDKAYAAGFFDGEGHISYPKSSKAHHLQVVVAQVDRAPLDWLQLYFGGRVRFYHNARAGIHRWTLSTSQAASFLEAVLPYLIVKHNEAVGALIDWNGR
jgi:hypothetical protein